MSVIINMLTIIINNDIVSPSPRTDGAGAFTFRARKPIMPQPIDKPMVERFISKLEKLESDVKPAWGSLRADQLVPHLIGAIRHSLGQYPGDVPFMGNWFTKNILFRVATSGLMPVPKNLKLKGGNGEVLPPLLIDGDLEALRAAMIEFIDAAGSPDSDFDTHPLFGDIGHGGWGLIHAAHVAHHLKQFGLS